MQGKKQSRLSKEEMDKRVEEAGFDKVSEFTTSAVL